MQRHGSLTQLHVGMYIIEPICLYILQCWRIAYHVCSVCYEPEKFFLFFFFFWGGEVFQSTCITLLNEIDVYDWVSNGCNIGNYL